MVENGKSAVIVGNAASLLGKGKGPEIDRVETIVRFNDFQVEGHEADVGKRLDIVWWGYNEPHPKMRHFKEVIFPWIGQLEMSLLLHKLSQACNNLKIPIKTLNHGIINKAYSILGLQLKQAVPKPSCGFVALLWAMERFNTVYYIGFDQFQTWHYYKGRSKPNTLGRVHDLKRERQVIDSWTVQGRIKKLF